jgi:DNA-binding NarL/FixJ family response regulator
MKSHAAKWLSPGIRATGQKNSHENICILRLPPRLRSVAKIKVLLADDHNVVRQGLRALLCAEGDMEIVGEAENGRQAVQLAKKFMPDVAVLDIAMPVLNGLEATRQITRAVPATKVLILSTYCDDEYVQQLTEAGAAGYLVKQTAATDLLKGIREAYRGNAFFSPGINVARFSAVVQPASAGRII